MTSHSTVRKPAGVWLMCLLFCALCTGTAGAQEQPPGITTDTTQIVPAVAQNLPVPQAPPRIAAVLTTEAGLGGTLNVRLDSASALAITQSLLSYRDLELFLDGLRFHSLHPQFIAPDILSFDLVYDDSSRAEWRVMLGQLREATHTARIGIGYEGQQEILPASSTPGYTPTFTFVVYREGWFIAAVLSALAALVLFWVLAVRSDVIRDSTPPEPGPGQRRPYSLARFQMALWFFVIVLSYLFIFLLTGQYNNVLNDESLILMGIGAGTALGAAMIDSNKNSTARSSLSTLEAQKSKLDAQLRDVTTQITDTDRSIAALRQPYAAPAIPAATSSDPSAATPAPPAAPPVPSPDTAEQLQELTQNRQNLKGQAAEMKSQIAALKTQIDDVYAGLQQPVSEGFLRDLLTDSNGISFHRFQILIWTLVLVAIFITEVYNDLLMPDFNATLLALMGISSGTYLGFKLPEQHTQPTPQSTTQTTA